MYLLYLDESENSNQNRKTPVDLNVFGMSGLLITSRYITNYIDEFRAVKKKNNIPENWEIHAFEIFSGSGKWSKKFSEEERRNICADFANLVAKSNRLKQAFFCYKESKLLKEDYFNSLESMLSKSVACVGADKNASGKQLLVIFDQKDDLEKEINQFVLTQRNTINSDRKVCGKMCRIIDHGFPGDSRFSELLQLSDFMGYIFRLSKTLKMKDNLFSKQQDQRYINFVDDLTKTMSKKVQQLKV